MDESRNAWIGLNLLDGVSPHLRARLVEACGGPLEVLTAGRTALRRTGLRSDIIDKIAAFDWKTSVFRELERIDRHGFSLVTPADAAYPEGLRHLYDPPPALAVRGTLEPGDARAVAVVGSRNATPYGLEMAREMGRDLAARGLTVVSGLAVGADSAAHRGALEAGGRTLAVLGSGLDVPYPWRNRGLMEEIASSGAVLSEFPLGTRPLPFHFPQRNRVIAALARGVVVVEATARSGSLGTVREAHELGRDIFAVPGRITSDRSLGTNLLIRRQEARLVLRAQDVLEELQGEKPRPEPEGAVADEVIPSNLPEPQAALLERIGPDEPVPVGDLARASGMELGPLLDALLALEMRRLVRPVPGGRYVRIGRP